MLFVLSNNAPPTLSRRLRQRELDLVSAATMEEIWLQIVANVKVSRAESLPSNTEPKRENHSSGACRCRPLLAFCAQSIEITWIAAIQSGRFATETS